MGQDDAEKRKGALDRALADAASHGDTSVVKSLLEAGADVHFAADQAILLAAKEGHTETVNALLKGGANPNPYKEFLSAAWYQAAMNGHEDTVRSLFDWADQGRKPNPPRSFKPG